MKILGLILAAALLGGCLPMGSLEMEYNEPVVEEVIEPVVAEVAEPVVEEVTEPVEEPVADLGDDNDLAVS